MVLDTPTPDWRDGFLFIGDQLAIDFVNTRLPQEDPIEMLPDWAAVVRWLQAAGLIDDSAGRRLIDQWGGTEAGRHAVARLKEFREALRMTIVRLEKRQEPSRGFIAALNDLLRAHPEHSEVWRGRSSRLQRRRLQTINRPEDAFAPIADATATLLVDIDRSRIHQCEGCVAHFFDASKNGLRRWCSMRLCGNRAKVAAYAARHRHEPDAQ